MNNKLETVVWVKIGNKMWIKFTKHIFKTVRNSLSVRVFGDINLDMLDFRSAVNPLHPYINDKLKLL